MLDIQLWLKDAMEDLGMQLAIVSQVEGNHYRVVAAYSSLDLVRQGDEFELDSTYCREVLRQAQTVAYERVGAITEMCLHPCYQALHLESYIGTPLEKDGKILGTLNFSSLTARAAAFTEKEKTQVESLAKEYLASV
ncbi:GAF domain-containing protein [Agarivorans sp. QJM3NY_29]|uniref:GAF domain-containing protein n=1 Tax=unclassified Agarivorans TaxID=2636026 RepID=UPI003D7E855C